MRIQHGCSFLLLMTATLATWDCSRASAPPPTPPDASAALSEIVDAKRAAFAPEDGDRGHHVWQEEQRFYKQNGYQLAWSDLKRPRGQLDGLVRAIRAADEDGLDPRDYHVDEIDAARRAALDRDQAVNLDVRTTYAYLRYAWDLTHGTIDPEDVNPQWHAAPRYVDLHNALESGLGDNTIGQSLASLAPASAQYLGLKHQLALARAKGDAAAIEQIVMNMERWRWLPDDLGPRYLLVNIPAFRLDAIENGKSVLDMKVVTGKKDSPTPVLADRMTTVVFSPYWNIPQDIVQKEILPFLFPNHYNVYLHDTPAQALFNRVERDFSHGCVRLDEPMDLARYVLRDQAEWTDDKIAAAMQAGTERAVPLKQPLPIYLVYFTAWEENGTLRTVPDVYGLDRRQAAAANAP